MDDRLEMIGLVEPFDDPIDDELPSVWATEFACDNFFGPSGDVIWPHEEK